MTKPQPLFRIQFYPEFGERPVRLLHILFDRAQAYTEFARYVGLSDAVKAIAAKHMIDARSERRERGLHLLQLLARDQDALARCPVFGRVAHSVPVELPFFSADLRAPDITHMILRRAEQIGDRIGDGAFGSGGNFLPQVVEHILRLAARAAGGEEPQQPAAFVEQRRMQPAGSGVRYHPCEPSALSGAAKARRRAKSERYGFVSVAGRTGGNGDGRPISGEVG